MRAPIVSQRLAPLKCLCVCDASSHLDPSIVFDGFLRRGPLSPDDGGAEGCFFEVSPTIRPVSEEVFVLDSCCCCCCRAADGFQLEALLLLLLLVMEEASKVGDTGLVIAITGLAPALLTVCV